MLSYVIELSAANDAPKSPAVAGGLCPNAFGVGRHDQPLGKRKNQAEYYGDEKDKGFLCGKFHSL